MKWGMVQFLVDCSGKTEIGHFSQKVIEAGIIGAATRGTYFLITGGTLCFSYVGLKQVIFKLNRQRRGHQALTQPHRSRWQTYL